MYEFFYFLVRCDIKIPNFMFALRLNDAWPAVIQQPRRRGVYANRRPKPNTYYPPTCPASQLEGLPDGYG